MKNYQLFFDNWFTSVGLVCNLQMVRIQSLGTVRPNRILNISLPSEKQMKKKGRGCVKERSTLVCGQRVRAVKYFGKRCVMLLTTYASILLSVEKQKYDSKERKKIPIQV